MIWASEGAVIQAWEELRKRAAKFGLELHTDGDFFFAVGEKRTSFMGLRALAHHLRVLEAEYEETSRLKPSSSKP